MPLDASDGALVPQFVCVFEVGLNLRKERYRSIGLAAGRHPGLGVGGAVGRRGQVGWGAASLAHRYNQFLSWFVRVRGRKL